mgnify:CR=1 FL=1
MGRMIDADALMEKLNVFNDKVNGNEHFINGIETAKELLDDMPSAYDTEKVIAELEEAFPINPYPNEFTNGRNLGIKKAIEIVRKGGAE